MCIALLLCALGADSRAEELDLRLRIEWGSGTARRWQGTIAAGGGTLLDVSTLGTDADEPGSIAAERGTVVIRQPAPRTYDGLDVTVHGTLQTVLRIELGEDDAAEAPIEIPLADLVSGLYDRPLDTRNNWLMVRRAPGDHLRVRIERQALVYEPGELLRFDLDPHLLGLKPGTNVNFEIQLREARGGISHVSLSRPQVVADGLPPLPRMPLEISLPKKEGVYDLLLSASVRKLKIGAPLGRSMLREVLQERKVQLLVVSRDPPAATSESAQVVDEINPASPNMWQRINNLPLMPGWRKGPLASGEARVWKYALGDRTAELVRIGLDGQESNPARLAGPTKDSNIAWQAYPLRVTTPGVPHILEIDYPANMPQNLGVSIVEPNAAGGLSPISLDSGVYVPEEAAGTPPRIEQHRLVFWPRTRSPLVLLTNRQDGQYAAYGKLRLLEGPPRLASHAGVGKPYLETKSAGRIPQTNERLLAGYFDKPLFAENFSASEALDPSSGRSLKDWVTFYEGGTRLVEYLHHTGRNAAFVSVAAEGGTLYPSETLLPTARFDSGSYFSSGQDPYRKDVVELLLQLFDREGLRLIPGIQFATPLPSLEALRREIGPAAQGLELIGSDGRTWRERHGTQDGLAPYYNPLDPRVQQAMLEVVGELASRYANHRSLWGLSIDLSADGYAQLPGAAWCLDDETISRFQRETGLEVPGQGPERFAIRAEALSGPLGAKWLSWRARKMAEFHRRLQAELRRHCPAATLYLTTGNLLKNTEAQRDLRRLLPLGTPITEMLINAGIDPELYRDARSPVLMRPQQLGMPDDLPAGPLSLDVNAAPELDYYFQQSPVPASLFFHAPQTFALASFDERGPFKNANLQLVSQASPSDYWNRRRFAHSLATLDAQLICDGGWMLPLGQEAATNSILAAYRALPAAKFRTFEEPTQPVTIRTYASDRESYLYLVNDSAWPVKTRLRLDLPSGCRMSGLGGRTLPAISGSGSAASWTLGLEPFDLIAVRFSSPDVQVREARVTWPEELVPRMEHKLQDLDARLAALVRLDAGQPEKPSSNHVVWNLNSNLPNAGFEQAADVAGQVPGWAVNQATGVYARVDRQEKYSGRQSAVLKSTGPVATLASPAFSAPQTGRLLMSVWIRVADPAVQPALRLALEGRLEGRPYYRFAPLGQGQPTAQLGKAWRSYLFRVDDLPLAGLTNLSIRFDLMGPGEVWIDDVQLTSVVLSQPELYQLQKTVFTARSWLEKGRISDSSRLLDGYWPRYLVKHVPPAQLLPHVDIPAPDSPQTARRDAPSAVREKPPGMLDRFLPWFR